MIDKLVYTAGPIRAKTEEQVKENLQRAKDIALELWKAGISVICPHANTDLKDDDMPVDGYEGEADWIAGDLVQIVRCDGILLLPGWENSEGSKEELSWAIKHGLDVFTSVKQCVVAYAKPLDQCVLEGE